MSAVNFSSFTSTTQWSEGKIQRRSHSSNINTTNMVTYMRLARTFFFLWIKEHSWFTSTSTSTSTHADLSFSIVVCSQVNECYHNIYKAVLKARTSTALLPLNHASYSHKEVVHRRPYSSCTRKQSSSFSSSYWSQTRPTD